MKKFKSVDMIVAAVFGLVVGVLILLALRFALYKPHKTHYHANFAIYINGQREGFKDDAYYEEETIMCSTSSKLTPSERAHMHNHVSDVVHVEDESVTWGNFLQNLGWGVGNKYLATPSNIYAVDADHAITFWLNGSPVADPSRLVIKDKDRLLISYGTADKSTVQKQYDSIKATAEKYNNSKDPAACGSHAGGSFKERMEHMTDFN